MFKSMKTGVLAAILISTAIYAHAQKKVTEGTIIYQMQYSPTAEQEPAVKMLPEEAKSKFNESITKFAIENGPATVTFIQNFVTNNGLFLLDVPVAQMQYAVKMTKADYDKQTANSPKLSDFKATGEKKVIATYNAEKYTYKDDKGATYELWATTDIEVPQGFYGADFKDVKGTLLVYTHFVNGIKTTSTFKKLTEEKVGTLSIDVPSGYEVKTMEDILALGGGGE